MAKGLHDFTVLYNDKAEAEIAYQDSYNEKTTMSLHWDIILQVSRLIWDMSFLKHCNMSSSGAGQHPPKKNQQETAPQVLPTRK